MSEEDLMGILGTNHQAYMESILKDYLILIIYLSDGDSVTIGAGGVKKKRVSCTPYALEVQYDSHKTDYLYDAMVRIEKYG